MAESARSASGSGSVLTMRADHNDYDYKCAYWYGDRSPARNRKGWVWSGCKPVPLAHREMNGNPTGFQDHRCPICNPYTEAEADELLSVIPNMDVYLK